MIVRPVIESTTLLTIGITHVTIFRFSTHLWAFISNVTDAFERIQNATFSGIWTRLDWGNASALVRILVASQLFYVKRRIWTRSKRNIFEHMNSYKKTKRVLIRLFWSQIKTRYLVNASARVFWKTCLHAFIFYPKQIKKQPSLCVGIELTHHSELWYSTQILWPTEW